MFTCLELICALLLATDCQGASDCHTRALLQVGSAANKSGEQLLELPGQVGQHEILLLDDSVEERSTGIAMSQFMRVQAAVKSHYCGGMLAILVFMCCCGSALAAAFGKNLAGTLNCCTTAGVLIYMFHSGAFHQWWAGEDVGMFCRVLSVWAAILLFFWGCCCCFVSSSFLVKNEAVKKMRAAFDAKEESFHGPRREYYMSAFFTQLCDELFDTVDVDKSGEVEINELRAIIVEMCGSKQIAQAAPLFMEAFDDSGDSKIQRSEFREIIRYFSIVRLEYTDDTSKDIGPYYEILQLKTNASRDEVEQAYLVLRSRWDPEKRKGVSEDEAQKDLGEVQEAYDRITKKFQVSADEAQLEPEQSMGFCRSQ